MIWMIQRIFITIKLFVMAEFKVGRYAICIDAGPAVTKGYTASLIKGKVYPVKDIAVSPCCGIVILDVGIIGNTEKHNCSKCRGAYVKPKIGVWWVGSWRFLPLDDFKEVTFEKINESMPVSAQ